MGMFSSSSKTSYRNTVLENYTNAYRTFAPWSFATLDPTASLAAMGSGTKLGTTDLGADFKADLQKKSAYEKELFGMEQKQIQRIQKRQESGEFLTPQETDFINQSLDKAFAYASTTGMEDMKQYADFLAGGRGLRTSDTPVAEPAMKEMRNFQLGLGSARAREGLGATMQLSGQQQQFEQGFAQFLASLRTGNQSERMGHMFGGGMTGAANVSYESKTKYSPSVMSSISQTIGVVGQAIDVAAKAGQLGKSDRRLKSSILRVGTHELGIGIYTYILDGRQDIGVMADEVLTVKPEAVVTHPDGYLMVDYAKL